MPERARMVRHPFRWAASCVVVIGLGTWALGSLGLYVGSYETRSWSVFVRHDGSKLLDENGETFCQYRKLRGVVTRSLAGRDMMAPQVCPWFDPGPKPLPRYDADDFTPISSYLRITQPPPRYWKP